SPGHDWLSYYNYYTGKRIKKTTLIETAENCRGDRDCFLDHLRNTMESSFPQTKERIILINLLDSKDDRNTPWPALKASGIYPDAVRKWFARYDWEQTILDDSERTRVFLLKSR